MNKIIQAVDISQEIWNHFHELDGVENVYTSSIGTETAFVHLVLTNGNVYNFTVKKEDLE